MGLWNWFNKVFGGGTKAHTNIKWETGGKDGCGMSWEQAKADAKNGWKVRDHNWPEGDYVRYFYYASGGFFLRWHAKERQSSPFFEKDAGKSIGMIWGRCGSVK